MEVLFGGRSSSDREEAILGRSCPDWRSCKRDNLGSKKFPRGKQIVRERKFRLKVFREEAV